MKNKLMKFISKGILALAMLAMPVQAKTVDIVGYKATLADGTVKKIADADSVAAALNDILAMIEKYHTDQSKTNDIPPIVVMYTAEWRLTDDEPWIISQSAAGNDIVPPTNMLPKMAYSRPLVMPPPPPEGVIPEETSLAIPATLTNMLECTFTGWKPEVPAKMPESNCVFVAQWQDPNVNQFTIKTTANSTNYIVYTAYFEEGESIADFNVTNPNYSVAFDPELPKTMPGTNFESYLTFTPNVPSTIAIDWKIIENVTTINNYVVGSELVPINQEIPDIVMVAFPRPLVGMPPLPEGILPIGTQITIPNPENNIFYGSFKGWTPVVPEIVPETNCVFTANIEEPTFHSFVVKYTKDEEDYVVYSGRFVKGESIADFNVTNSNYSVAFDPELPKTMPDADIISYVEFTTNSIISNNITKAYYSDGSIQEYDIEGELGENSINKTNLIAIEIGDAVTNIGYHAFYNCSKLTSITIPNSVTNIDNNAFYNCSGLTSIMVDQNNSVYDSRNNCNAIIQTADNTLIIGCKNTIIPNSVTVIREWAFGNCSGLTSITIPDSVTSIGTSAFSGCSSLTSVTIGNSVTNIGIWSFNCCYMLTSIIIPASVTSIGWDAFSSCFELASIVVNPNNQVYDSRNNCNAIIKTSTNELIVGCKNTIIPDGVMSIEDGAFDGCLGLTSITIPDGVTSIEYMAFRNCSSLTSVTIPGSVTNIGMYAFSNCSSLMSILCLATTAPAVTKYTFGDDNFTYTGHDTYSTGNNVLKVPAGATGYDTSYWADPLQDSTKCGFHIEDITDSSTTRVIYPDGSIREFNIIGDFTRNSVEPFDFDIIDMGNAITNIDREAFMNRNLSSIKIGKNVLNIDRYAFYECTNLTSITIPDSVLNIAGYAFKECNNIESIIIGNSVTNIGADAFVGCNNATSIVCRAMTAPTIASSTFGYYANPSDYTGKNYKSTGINTLYILQGATGYNENTASFYWRNLLDSSYNNFHVEYIDQNN